VNYILKEQSQWKICIIENEFGEVPIDNDLVEENLAAKEDIITMDNGCICCSVRGDLVRTFNMLIKRRKDFDAIIIETTGLADPAPIVFTFNNNSAMTDNFRIDSIVCLVDAKHVSIHLDDVKPDGNVNEAEHQIAFADRILLNKIDLISADELEDVEDRIRSINSFAQIIKTQNSRAPLDKILGLNSFSLEKMVEIDPTIMDPEEHEDEHSHEGHVHDEHCQHDHNDSGHVHDEHCQHDHNDSGHVHDEHCQHDHNDSGHVHDEHCQHDHNDSGHVHDEHCQHDHNDSGHVHDEHCQHDHSSGHGHEEHGHHGSEHGHDGKHEHSSKKKKKTHNLSLVSSVGFTIEGLLDVPKFNDFMTGLLQQKAKDLYRTKGVLAFSDQGDTKFVFQGVHEQINFGPSDRSWAAGEARVSKMVFIGKNLDYEFLRFNLQLSATDPDTCKVTMHKR
jgi:G3E family GTPase